MSALRSDQVLRILELTDLFNLHRESVFIPLKVEEEGSVTILPDGRLRIICPKSESFDNWLEQVPSQLEKLDLSKIKH